GLDADSENLATAIEWGLESRPWDAVRMTVAALVYWDQRAGTLENDARILAAIRIARARVAATPAPPSEDQALAALMLGRAAEYWATLGRGTEGAPWGREAL